MKKMLVMLLALILFSLNYSCSDDESTNLEQTALQNQADIQTASLEEINTYLNFQNISTAYRISDSINNEDSSNIIYIDAIDSEAQIGVLEREVSELFSSQYIFYKKEGQLVKNSIEINSDGVYETWDTFSGEVIVSELEGARWAKYEYENGSLNRISRGDYSLIQAQVFSRSLGSIVRSETCCDGYIDEVVFTGGGSTGTPVDSYPRFPSDTGAGGLNADQISMTQMQPPPGGAGTPSYSPNTIIKSTSFKNTKAECVFNKLGGTNSKFKNLIKKFDGNFPVSHLKFSLASLSPNTNAHTKPPVNYITEIVINKNNLNRPNLSIARTIIHETIHAEMFRKMLSLANTNGSIDPIKLRTMLNNNNFPGMFNYYTQYGINGFQHEQMASHYRNIIIEAIKIVDPNQSQSLYEGLSWTGLQGTQAWNKLSQSKKNSINNIVNNYNAKGSQNCN